MRLPIPFLLYVTALGLFGWAGWTVYESRDLWDPATNTNATNDGQKQSQALLARGKGKGPATSGEWNFGAKEWWEQLKQVNLIGKLPERQPTAAELAAAKVEEAKPDVDMTPLEDIFELVSLVYDGTAKGEGGETHVVIRYKQDANVEPPEWWVRENTPATPGMSGMSRDVVTPRATATRTGRPNRPGRNINRGTGRPGGAPAASTMPTSAAVGGEILQKVWVDAGDDERHSSTLWPGYEHIRLVRVAPDAQSAFFVRELPPPEEGQPAPEPKEEELLKTTADIPQDVLTALRKLQGREGDRRAPAATQPRTGLQWHEVEETTRVGNAFLIGRKDERRFRDNADDFFNGVHVDTYVSKSSSLRGLSVRSVQPEMAQRFGVQTGDVLLEINGREVSSKAQAMQRVKADYKRGVRTFATKWLSNGQVVERNYQAPDK